MKLHRACIAAIIVAFATNTLVAQAQESKHEWWETTVFYQIYPRSFLDTDENRNGDIKGVIEKLSYLKELGVGATWLSPIFDSPMKDGGYDIKDFEAVNPLFGSMTDLENLFAEAKKLDIKIILDFVPNHSSDQCEWFIQSAKNATGYEDFYVWQNPKSFNKGIPVPPNNWMSVFGGSAWEYHEGRQQFYLHQFVKEQPDLNYRNSAVVSRMKEVLKFWLKKGASGFRVDAINHMFEAADFRDEPVPNPNGDPNDYGYTTKDFTKDLPETYDMVYQFRAVLDEFYKENGGNVPIMMTEAYANTSSTMLYYQSADGTREGSQMPFNFVLIESLNEYSKAQDFQRVIEERLAAIPNKRRTNWVIGNHDQSRFASRYGSERVDSILTLLMTLPGVAVTYQGEEIGMVDNRDGISWEQTDDPQACNAGREHYKERSRDPARTPFQWDDSKWAGFSTGSQDPWLPVNPNYPQLNVKLQQGQPRSTLSFYKQLVKLRQEPAFVDGIFRSKAFNDNVYAYVRSTDTEQTYVVVLNFGNSEYKLNATELGSDLEDELVVVAAGSQSSYSIKDKVPSQEILIKKYDAVVFRNSADRFAASIALLILAMLNTFKQFIR